MKVTHIHGNVYRVETDDWQVYLNAWDFVRYLHSEVDGSDGYDFQADCVGYYIRDDEKECFTATVQDPAIVAAAKEKLFDHLTN